MVRIPKNLSDKVMVAGFKEEKNFEHMFLAAEEDEPFVKPKPKEINKEKEDISTAFLTKELQEKIGKSLLELKLELYKDGLVDYDIKVVRDGKQIVLSAVPIKKKANK
ncbi:MAG: hypothetical protein H6Q70_3550 [Firmicutes bacterium]|jgi:hypothetical protein|nr:hypothetical protein [Bacillota bacterium]